MKIMRPIATNIQSTLHRGRQAMRDLWKLAGLLCVVTLLSACSGDSFVASADGASSGGGGNAPGCSSDPTCTVSAAAVIATTDKISIKSDGFDEATITATVLDTSRAAIEKATVTFSVTTGKLSTAVGITDKNGQVTTKFSASPENPSNGITLVTATVAGVGSYVVPVEITGTTLSVSSQDGKKTIIVSTAPTKTLLVKAANAAGLGVYGASIAFSLSGDEDGTVVAPAGTTISPNPATTDISGTATITLTGSASGDVWVTATGLGATDQEEFLIQDATAFRISAPTPAVGDEFVEMISGGGMPQTVTVTAGLNNVAVGSTIWFTTTFGNWSNGLTYMSVPFTAASATTGSASATLTSGPGDNGFATVYAFVESNTKHNDSIFVAMSPPVSDSAQIIVQSEEKTLFPNTSTTTFSTKVHVQVRTNDATGNYPIANAPVTLELQNATGGGENLAQGYGFTDVYGNFVTTFTAGVMPTGQLGVRVVATVADSSLTPAVTSFATIEIGGVPGSVALGTPREIVQDDDNHSINTYIMSALVADGTGAAVSGAPVTLHFWPTEYYTGVWWKGFTPDGDETWFTLTTGSFRNEDLDEDGIMDPGEDVNLNGQLDPQGSYGGTSPAIVTTGSNGAAPFNYVYLKDAADWVNVRAQGSTKVFGTEATTSTEFVPRSLKAEVDIGNVNDSPFRLWVLIDISDGTGIAMVPGSTTAWNAPSTSSTANPPVVTQSTVDKGTINASSNYVLGIGSYVAGDTESVTVTTPGGVSFPLSVRFIP